MSKVSVIIPTSDRHDFLKRAIKSLQAQTFCDFSVIVIDDGSSIPVVVPDIVVGVKKILLIRNKKRLGAAVCRNIGVYNSSAEYVCFLDDDDEYLPNKLSSLFGILNSSPNIQAVYGNTLRTDGKVPFIRRFLRSNSLVKSFLFIPTMHTNSSLVRRSVFDRVVFNEDLEKYQDTQFYLELITKFNVIYVDIDVCKWYVSHGFKQITSVDDDNDIRKVVNNIKRFSLYALSIKGISKLNAFLVIINYHRVVSKYKHDDGFLVSKFELIVKFTLRALRKV